jgi:hypothetical protein
MELVVWSTPRARGQPSLAVSCLVHEGGVENDVALDQVVRAHSKAIRTDPEPALLTVVNDVVQNLDIVSRPDADAGAGALTTSNPSKITCGAEITTRSVFGAVPLPSMIALSPGYAMM